MPRRRPLFRDLVQIIDELPTLLRLMRQARGLALRDVAVQSGVSFNALSRIERGQTCDVSTLRLLLIWLDESEDPRRALTEGQGDG